MHDISSDLHIPVKNPPHLGQPFLGEPLFFEEGKPIIGSSENLRRIFHLVNKLARVETSVLIRGESGTGKELIARALHYNSPKKDGPFVAVNCGAIPENLIESELFGFEKGTFTGADRPRMGKFQCADGGSIFLDEIGDVSPSMQVKLLRVLQEKKITPVGSNREIPLNIRILSATNKPLEKMIKAEEFRSDLFYRLNVLPINLPPLRDRIEDIPALCEFLIDRFNKFHGRQIQDIAPRALDALKRYDWPGNIRELENIIEHAFIIEPTNIIEVDSLPTHFQNGRAQPIGSDIKTRGSLLHGSLDLSQDSEMRYPVLKEKFEKEFITSALKIFRGRINQTAEQTQMTKVTLLRKMEKYGIDAKLYQ